MKKMFLVFKLVINNKNKINNNLIKFNQTNYPKIINSFNLIPTFREINLRDNQYQ